MNIHSSPTHQYADGRVGEVFESTKHFWSLRINLVSAESDTIELTGDRYFRRNKTTEKNRPCLHTARVVSSKCPQAPTFIFDSKQDHLHPVLSLMLLCTE